MDLNRYRIDAKSREFGDKKTKYKIIHVQAKDENDARITAKLSVNNVHGVFEILRVVKY